LEDTRIKRILVRKRSIRPRQRYPANKEFASGIWYLVSEKK